MSIAMRNVGLSLSVAAAAVLFLAIRAHDAGTGAAERPAARALEALSPTDGLSPIDGDAERIAHLEERLEELSAALALLSARFDGLAPSREPSAPEPIATSGDETKAAGSVAPEWYLEQYVLSFRGGGNGSEYFRLAVEAFAPSLLPQIAALVTGGSSNPLLQRRLIEILGDARFAGDGRVIDVLLRVAGGSADPDVVQAAVTALATVGDARTGIALERLIWSIPFPGPQRDAIRTVVQLAGEGANAAVARLLATAADPAARAFLISLVRQDDLAAALDAFRLASQDEQPVRLQAAHGVGSFRTEEFQAFVDQWIELETDEEVKSVLRASRRKMDEVPSWSAMQAAGPPDADSGNDDPRAWASERADMGEQWLELTYDPPRRANGLRIHEVNVPGAVVRVVAFEAGGGTHTLWSGVDPTPAPGVFELAFDPTPYRVQRIRIVLDTNLRAGWNEIDAVELLGPDGSAYAKSAVASSNYDGG